MNYDLVRCKKHNILRYISDICIFCSHVCATGCLINIWTKWAEYMHMKTLWNGNIFHVTGPLWGESTSHPTCKGQWRSTLKFSLICAWTNGLANNQDAGDLRCHCAHYDITVMNIRAIMRPNNITSYLVLNSQLSSSLKASAIDLYVVGVDQAEFELIGPWEYW